jgi:hypothetical protein
MHFCVGSVRQEKSAKGYLAGRASREDPMKIPETYGYVVRARRDLWAAVEGVLDEVLSRPLLDGSRSHAFMINACELSPIVKWRAG